MQFGVTCQEKKLCNTFNFQYLKFSSFWVLLFIANLHNNAFKFGFIFMFN